MSSYFELERRLARFGKVRGKMAAKPAQPAAAIPPTNGNGNGKSAAAWRSVRAFTAPVSYRVPGIVPPVRQPTNNTCWSTVTTMMASWRQNASTPIDAAMGAIGADYLAKFQGNQGLMAQDKGPFLAAAGLVAEPPMSYSIEGWLQLLRTYGPLWVTTDEDPGATFAIHARIMVGIEGDGTPDGTSVRVVDPATATEYSESMPTFYRKFEEEARALKPNQPLRIQVVHWPANAQSQSQSHGRMRSRSYSSQPMSYGNRRARAFDDDAGAAPPPLAWGAKMSPEFRTRLREIATRLKCSPDQLCAAMAFETGETFSPSIRNRLSGATGLIQFMPSTAKGLGTTTDVLAGMTAVQQLDYVEKYMRPFVGRLNSIEDVYLAILWPSAVGKPGNTVLMSRDSSNDGVRRAYEQNQGLDADQGGTITKDEAAEPVRRKLAKGLLAANAA